MKYNININQIKCIEYWLNLQQWAILDLIGNTGVWAEWKVFEWETYYYLSAWKIIEEYPIISDKKNTILWIIKNLLIKWLIIKIFSNNKSWYKLTKQWKSFFTSVEKNQEGYWKKSIPSVEKNQYNNITSNNITINKINKPKNEFLGLVKKTDRNSYLYKLAKDFLNIHILKFETPSIIYLLKNKWEVEILEKWVETLEKLKRIDWYSEEQIEFILKFTLENDFWKNQILSIEKLRKKNKEQIPYFIVLINEAKKLQPKKRAWITREL